MVVDTLAHMSRFFNPLFIIDMIVKTAILYAASVYVSQLLEILMSKLPYVGDDIDKGNNFKTWAQVLIRISVCAPIAFLFRTLIEYLGNRFDFLDEVMSPMSAKGASLIAGMAFFTMQEGLAKRIKELKTVVKDQIGGVENYTQQKDSETFYGY